MSEEHLIQAKNFAIAAHKNLCRNSKSQEPQVVHLAEVANLTSLITHDPVIIAAAWLHDIVEDTNVTILDINQRFGERLTMLVDGLTDPAGFEMLPLAERKLKQASRLQGLHRDVKLVKVCDQLSNIKAVYFDPPENWDKNFSWLYISSASQVAQACSGISEFIDQQVKYYVDLSQNKYCA